MLLFSSMPPRPIHRWKTLWLGIILVTFLSWAWWQSTHTSAYFRCYRLTICHAGAGISLLYWAPGSRPAPPLKWNLYQINPSLKAWRHAFLEAPKAILSRDDPDQILEYYDEASADGDLGARNSAAIHFIGVLRYAAPGSRAIFIPHWLLILAFLVPWSAFLIWRWRRIHHPTPRPEPKGT